MIPMMPAHKPKDIEWISQRIATLEVAVAALGETLAELASCPSSGGSTSTPPTQAANLILVNALIEIGRATPGSDPIRLAELARRALHHAVSS